MSALLGIFVGGASRRMGGRPKGLLPAPGTPNETIVEALVRFGSEAGLAPVLVGEAAAYEDVAPDVPRIADRPPGVGPLGGLNALLERAGDGLAIAVACDMPYVETAVLCRLRDHSSEAAVVAPRTGARWEPLLARYRAAAVRPILSGALAEGIRSFQDLFARVDVAALPLDPHVERALADWDRPEDVREGR